MANVSDNRCSVSVTVEELYTICPCSPKYFTVEIRNSSGEVVARGQVAGGNSAVFSLPCNGTYAVTVIGDANSSPRSQTRRVKCCCGEANGLTFIFTVYEPMCSQPIPPCPDRCDPCGCGNSGCCDPCSSCGGNSGCGNGCDCCENGEECYELTINRC